MNFRAYADLALRRIEDVVGVDVLPRRYWSPIPYDIPDGAWDRRSSLRGQAWDLDRQSRLYEQITPLMDGAVAGGMLGLEDARALRGMIRYLRPARVIELGSGHSTRIIRAATTGAHVVYDPYPDDGLRTTGTISVVRRSAVEVPIAEFETLQSGDVLFVDTSHVVKIASDVNYIVLEVLPALREGVWVHFHDIFLPWEYPRQLVQERRLYWAEQYLLEAFLAFNDSFVVELALYALAREGRIQPQQVAPGSFWLRRVPA